MAKKIIGIIATKNRNHLLKIALASALNQTRKLDELIVVSDSDDDVFESDQALCESKCIFLKDRYTRNYAGNLNTAIDCVVLHHIIQGNENPDNIYIAFLDDDDSWKETYIESCNNVLCTNPDFVVAGLNYYSEGKSFPLSVPSYLDQSSFLSKNPHIQGSNTFIKLSTLLKAGCFDEALNSTTDRDFFTRVMMLKPKYEIINEALVDVDAHDDRPRLTNNSRGKRESLSYFYSKYSGLMDEDEKSQFFERAKRYTDLSEKGIEENLPKEGSYIIEMENDACLNERVIFGFIVSDEELGSRLVHSISSLHDIRKTIVILCNLESPSQSFLDEIGNSDIVVYSLSEAKKIGKELDSLSFALDSLDGPGQIKDIAVSRTILHELLKKSSNDDDILWVLDDDMVFEYLTRSNGEFIKNKLDIRKILSMYKEKADVVIGSYSEDAPLPTLSTLRTSLLDYVYHEKLYKAENYRTDIYENRDYYYDLSDNHIGLETPLKTYAKSLEDVFSGKETSRKLFVKEIAEFEPYCRGGNTIIYNRKVLDIPNVSPRFGNQIARRGDYFWVEQAKANGFNIIGSSFATLHSKKAIDFDLNKEADKLLKDLLGSSFTKAIAQTVINGSRKEFYESFKDEYENRLTRIAVSFYRIIGLLHILEKDSYKGFDVSFIKRFIEKSKYYLYEPMVRSSYDVVRRITSRYSLEKKKDEIVNAVGEGFELLGYGLEGISLKLSDSTIYKVFYEHQDFDFLRKASINFEKCPQLEKLEFQEIHGYSVIKYHQDPSFIKYQGGHAKEVAALIRFLKDEGLVITNIKRENFILIDGKLKFIDYGKSFKKLDDVSFQRQVKRAYEMIKYPDLSENDFTELIERDYMNDDNDLLFGIENFQRLIVKREKEAIHDGVIIETIKKYSPKSILDYGAGKCKIMNKLSDEADCYAFDIDTKTLHARASKNVFIIDKIEDFQKEVDLVVSNLVLCNVTEEWDDRILTNISRVLKKNGHAIISICNPFFDSIDNTELRSEGYRGEYELNSLYTKQGLYGPKEDYHRPFSYYENLFKRHGFQIVQIIETDGVSADTLNPISEHMVFDVINNGCVYLSDCTLMIKVCSMDHEIATTCIKQIIDNLENGCLFHKKIVSVDLSDEDRNRRYSDDDKERLLDELCYLKNHGTIDEIVIDNDHKNYLKWFGQDSSYEHCENGQQLLATINGFETVETRYVFQTDIDILYKTNNFSFVEAFEKFKESKAITGTLGIYRTNSIPETYGNRTEVRSCFLDLEALDNKLPLKNPKNDKDQFVLPWHRALDDSLSKDESVRFADSDIFFVHLPNSMKKDNFMSAYLLGNIPATQEGKVDAVEDIKAWYPKAKRPIAVFSRGKNVGVEKIKRLIDSLKAQDCQDFDFVYIDDCSSTKEQEYLYSLSKYDSWCKEHMILILNAHSVKSLANFDIAMKYILVDPNTIVINVDGDDALIGKEAISTILEVYKNGADITCGGCFRADKPTQRYSISSFKRCWERNGDNIWLHPKTFRRYLADYIGDFLMDGDKYVDVHTDYAMLLPIVEASKHPVEIKKNIYYFEPSKENKTKSNQYEQTHRREILDKLLKKAERRFMKPIVSVIGDAVVDENDEEYLLGVEIGKSLVDAGYRVQTGGLGGIMEAVLKGARESSKYEFGDTIAILPGNDESEANEYADIKVATGLDNMRAKQVVDAYAVIAIGGGAGTLAEIATAWSMYKLIIAWDKKGWSAKLANSKVDDRCRYKEINDDRLYSFKTADEAVELIKNLGDKYQKEYHGIKWRKKR